jgi:hypothetical protein
MCQHCQRIFKTWTGLTNHVVKAHNLPRPKPSEARACLHKSRNHKCHVCGQDVLQSYAEIRNHLSKVHSMSVQDYEKQ